LGGVRSSREAFVFAVSLISLAPVRSRSETRHHNTPHGFEKAKAVGARVSPGTALARAFAVGKVLGASGAPGPTEAARAVMT